MRTTSHIVQHDLITRRPGSADNFAIQVIYKTTLSSNSIPTLTIMLDEGDGEWGHYNNNSRLELDGLSLLFTLYTDSKAIFNSTLLGISLTLNVTLKLTMHLAHLKPST